LRYCDDLEWTNCFEYGPGKSTDPQPEPEEPEPELVELQPKLDRPESRSDDDEEPPAELASELESRLEP